MPASMHKGSIHEQVKAFSFRNLLMSTVDARTGKKSKRSSKSKATNGKAHARIVRANVFPRRKKGESARSSTCSLSLSLVDIKSLFYMRQSEAATFLGISLTAMKNACRRVGISRWPYSRQRPDVTSKSKPRVEEVKRLQDIHPKQESVPAEASDKRLPAPASRDFTGHCDNEGSKMQIVDYLHNPKVQTLAQWRATFSCDSPQELQTSSGEDEMLDCAGSEAEEEVEWADTWFEVQDEPHHFHAGQAMAECELFSHAAEGDGCLSLDDL
eukprot:338747-Hanusia_phi.AAC.3